VDAHDDRANTVICTGRTDRFYQPHGSGDVAIERIEPAVTRVDDAVDVQHGDPWSAARRHAPPRAAVRLALYGAGLADGAVVVELVFVCERVDQTQTVRIAREKGAFVDQRAHVLDFFLAALRDAPDELLVHV